MNIAIHQPQYLPWLLYLLKIEEADRFIILDTVDFQKNGLHNRNQIKTAQGAHWLTVPVRQQLGQIIRDVQIDNSLNWKRKHWKTIQQCYCKAPAFEQYADELEQFFSYEWQTLNELNIRCLGMLMTWMGIQTPTVLSSQMKAIGAASELILNLCLEAGATQYLSGTGGKEYLDSGAFERAGIKILYRPSRLPTEYPQQYPKTGFINTLSVLDLLFNCGERWRNYLPSEDYNI